MVGQGVIRHRLGGGPPATPIIEKHHFLWEPLVRKHTAWKVAAILLATVVMAGCPGTTHTVKVGYLYEPEETGVSHLTGYGATAAVSFGAPGLVSVEGCGLFTYVHTVQENLMTHVHNLPASYCMEVGL